MGEKDVNFLSSAYFHISFAYQCSMMFEDMMLISDSLVYDCFCNDSVLETIFFEPSFYRLICVTM